MLQLFELCEDAKYQKLGQPQKMEGITETFFQSANLSNIAKVSAKNGRVRP